MKIAIFIASIFIFLGCNSFANATDPIKNKNVVSDNLSTKELARRELPQAFIGKQKSQKNNVPPVFVEIKQDHSLKTTVAAFLTPLIALFGALIAFQQWKINNLRLKHELFDRNFKVYESIMSFIGSVVTSGKAGDEQLYKFNKETRAAKFLFSSEIKEFIDQIYNKSIDLQTLDAEMEGSVGEERGRIAKERGDIKKWIYRQFGELDEKFEKTLGLNNKSLWEKLLEFLSNKKQ